MERLFAADPSFEPDAREVVVRKHGKRPTFACETGPDGTCALPAIPSRQVLVARGLGAGGEALASAAWEVEALPRDDDGVARLELEPVGRLNVIVTDPRGQGLVGSRLVARPAEVGPSAPLAGVAPTLDVATAVDADGRVRLELPAGVRVDLRAFAPGVASPTSSPYVFGEREIRLWPAGWGRLTGRVVGPDGSTIPDAEVRIEPGDLVGTTALRTDAAGHFEVEIVRAGTAWVTAAAGEWLCADAVRADLPPSGGSCSVEVPLVAGVPQGVLVAWEDGTPLEAGLGVEVLASQAPDPVGDGEAAAGTLARTLARGRPAGLGRFTLERLVPGRPARVKVSAVVHGRDCSLWRDGVVPGDELLRIALPDAWRVSPPLEVEVVEAATGAPLQVARLTATGRVPDTDEPDGLIGTDRFVPDGPGRWRAPTAPLGPDLYLHVDAPGFVPLEAGPFPATQRRLRLECVALARVSVRIRWPDGSPVRDGTLHLVPSLEPQGPDVGLAGHPATSLQIPAEGTCVFETGKPRVTLTASAVGSDGCQHRSKSVSLPLCPGDVRRIELVIAPWVGRLRVRTHAADGGPRAGTEIVLVHKESEARPGPLFGPPRRVYAMTDEHGEVLIDRLDPGLWTVAAARPGPDGAPEPATVSVDSGQEARIDVTVPPGS